MGFPLERGSVEDGILTCHWHHARFDLGSGCTFDLWADDVPVCPVEVRNGDVWVKTTFTHADPAAHWHQRLANGLAHDLGLVIAKAVHAYCAPRISSPGANAKAMPSGSTFTTVFFVGVMGCLPSIARL
jgi:hypothetical protein